MADNSALASSLGGPNPTLTTQALATRTGERISFNGILTAIRGYAQKLPFRPSSPL
ncbi:MAG TPA: hypothetical protein VKE96_35000 [Vicinamibacterales bacterium]|nr:hypothetical protein [Vicinamibacterales bacterium]